MVLAYTKQLDYSGRWLQHLERLAHCYEATRVFWVVAKVLFYFTVRLHSKGNMCGVQGDCHGVLSSR